MKCGCVAQGVRTAERGVKIDPPIPCCLTHDCVERADSKPDLTGRFAKCTYSHVNPKGRQSPGKSPVPSSFELAFFEFCGEGSREATEYCKCGMSQKAHDDAGRIAPRKYAACMKGCTGFTPKGPQEFDRFYCGCFGWD